MVHQKNHVKITMTELSTNSGLTAGTINFTLFYEEKKIRDCRIYSPIIIF